VFWPWVMIMMSHLMYLVVLQPLSCPLKVGRSRLTLYNPR